MSRHRITNVIDNATTPAYNSYQTTNAQVDDLLFVTPQYIRPIPGGQKNVIDWASRPYGQTAFAHMPVALIGASPGSIGTAVVQQSLRGARLLQRTADDKPGSL